MTCNSLLGPVSGMMSGTTLTNTLSPALTTAGSYTLLVDLQLPLLDPPAGYRMPAGKSAGRRGF